MSAIPPCDTPDRLTDPYVTLPAAGEPVDAGTASYPADLPVSPSCLADLRLNHPRFVRATGLYVTRSTLGPEVGLGLFAARRLPAGQVIAVYGGILPTEWAIHRSNQPDWDQCLAFTMELADPETGINAGAAPPWVDAGPLLQSMPARYINHSSRADRRNVAWRRRPHLLLAEVITLRDIQPGEELFADYGPQYWTAGPAPVNE
ncbi:hypothetical protein H696_02995 [Fonticula alba]|uniref:SET domain-containing protein n=1 Tax=Fonticula alba TaxID=691883 RepID=A0A058Z8L5_FONAL|nr:hypothetical protein H696_02995 [Fonticula alba]KCV70639.1 hypothetical protein H696_02995 [Fonticula alba]|eukprot:XP_009495155.1 hypothetical protein H696_02995 [Fonticula alba]